VFALPLDVDMIRAGVLAKGLTLLGRLVGGAVPFLLRLRSRPLERYVIPIMSWGGLTGGISVALALSLAASDWKPTILAATYFVVVFSIIVQGLTVAPLARWLKRRI
jgi:CPA1 family monovalent cation:H+ antiporter